MATKEQFSIVADTGELGSNESNEPRCSPSASTCEHSERLGKGPSSKSEDEMLMVSAQPQKNPRPWRTTVIRFGPLSGILGTVIAMASIVASLGILAGSDNQGVKHWLVPPSTYLAIFTALANLSMRYAAIQGVIIAWWNRAQRGTTMADLHWDWHAGTTLRGAIASGRRMGLLGLACIFSTIVVIDGPLLQKASSVVIRQYADEPVPLNITMMPEIPTAFTGIWYKKFPGTDYVRTWGSAFNDSIPTNHGIASNHVNCASETVVAATISKSWYNDLALTGVVEGCPSGSVCEVRIQAPALFPTVCTSHSIRNDYDFSVGVVAERSHTYAPPLTSDAFLILPSLLLGEREAVNLITGYATGSGCATTLNYNICTLEAGVGEYIFTVENDRATVSDDSALKPDFIAFANNTAVNHTFEPLLNGNPATLGGVIHQTYNRYNSLAFYQKNGSSFSGTFDGAVSFEQYVDVASLEGTCFTFEDPQEDMIRSMNKLMIYYGAYAAFVHPSDFTDFGVDTGVESKTSTHGYLKGPHPVFHTNYYFFLGAAIVELVCITLVAPTYWGWWKLGRPMSFSPLEMAKAFQSPMLTNYDSNSSARDLANTTKTVRIKYGAMKSSTVIEKTVLAFSGSTAITSPRKGDSFAKV